MIVQAYRYENGQLDSVWRWDNVGLGKEYQGQGAHWMHAADVDGDGRDEIILGSLVLDDDGKPLWTTGLGHPDHFYVGDIDPNRPGLEIYYGIETRQQKNGMCLVDAATGKILWGHDQPTRHVHGQGLCADLDPRYPGASATAPIPTRTRTSPTPASAPPAARCSPTKTWAASPPAPPTGTPTSSAS